MSNVLIDHPITQARLTEKMFRIRFEQEKAQEWKERVADLKAETARVIWNAYTSGMPVTQIAKHYGTKSRGTIYKIINEERERLAQMNES